MEFRVLGPLEVVKDGLRLDLGGPKQRVVLALLVANAGRQISVGSLIDGVYGDDAPDRAHRSIHTFVSNLRAVLGDVIKSQSDGYVLTGPEATIDATRFVESVEAAYSQDDPGEVRAMLRSALDLWRGHPYSDIEARTGISAEITRLNELRLAATEARIDAELASGRARELVGELEALTAEHPFRERFHAQLMLALYRSGRQAEALRAFSRTRELLIEELGVEPSPTLRDLEQRILEQDPRLQLAPETAVRHRAVLVIDLTEGAAEHIDGPDERRRMLGELSRTVQTSISSADGTVAAQQGTATYSTFNDVGHAIAAASAVARTAPRANGVPIVRVGVDVGDVEQQPNGSVGGPAVIRAAGLVAAAHPGQVLLSADAQADAVSDHAGGLMFRALGRHSIRRLETPETVHQLVIDGLPTKYPQLLTSDPPDLPSTHVEVPGYELREEIGSGLFGTVYLGYQPSVGREVAIKAIRPELANSVDFIRRFAVEARMVADLEHPNVVPLYDFWRGPSGALLVMRLLRGGSLEEWLADTTPDRQAILRLVDQVGGALATAHQLGIAHGDIHARNVLLDEAGDFFLGDFGIASEALHAGSGMSQQLDVAAFGSMILNLAPTEFFDAEAADLLLAAQAGEYTSASKWLEEWRRLYDIAIPTSTFTPTRNPYKGLVAFGELDAQDFHGRQRLTDELVSAVSAGSLTAVVGPSGVGKSSVVRAGLLPALRRGAVEGSEQWLIADCVPGSRPVERLAAALLRVASKGGPDIEEILLTDKHGLLKAVDHCLPAGSSLLLVVDQFEELFTLTRDPDMRRRFMDLLAATAADHSARVRVLVTLRADFFDRPLRHPEFGELVRRGTVSVPAPNGAEIREMIEAPARGVGVSYEPGLVDLIVADVEGEIGALPLLEFALTELFDGRESDVLSLASYQASGGVTAALGRRAEAVYEQLRPDLQSVVRQLLLRLVSPSESGRDTRRRVRIAELYKLGFAEHVVDEALSRFGEARLLTFDQHEVTRGPTVEVAHEALLTEWPRLMVWLDTHREDLVLRGRLEVAVDEWEAAERADEYLLARGHLAQHEAWTATTDLSLSSGETALLQESRAAEAKRTAGIRRRRQLVLASLGAAALVTSVLALVAWEQRNSALEERSVAEARGLVVQAESLVEDDPELATHLALVAIETFSRNGAVPASAVDGLRQAVEADRILSRLPGSTFVDVSPDGSTFLAGDGAGGVAIWDLASVQLIDSLVLEGTDVQEGLFSSDGSRIYLKVGLESTGLTLMYWEPATGLVRSVPGATSPSAFDLAWIGVDTHNGLISVQAEEGVRILDDSGAELHRVDGVRGPFDFSTGRLTAVAFQEDDSPTLVVVDGVTGAEATRTAGLPFIPEDISVSPDGRLAAISRSQGAIAMIDLDAGSELWLTELDVARKALWVQGGERILVGGEAPFSLIEAATGDVVRQISANNGPKFSYAAIPGTDHVLSAGFGDEDVLRVDIADHGDVFLRPGIATSIQISADGTHLLAHGANDFAVTRLDTGAVVTEQIGEDSKRSWGWPFPAFTRNGRFVSGHDEDGLGRVWSVPSAGVVFTATPGWHIVGLNDDASLVVMQLFDDEEHELATQVVSVRDGTVVAEVDAGGHIFSTEFTSDGTHLLTNNNGGSEPINRIWDLEDGGRLVNSFGTLEDHAGISTDVTLDGTKLVIGGFTGDLFVFDFGKLVDGASPEAALDRRIPAHSNFSGAQVSADGKLIATSAWNERVKVWDLQSGRLLDVLGNTQFKDWAFHPSQPLLFISQEGVVSSHLIDAESLIELARASLSRPMTDEECMLYLRRACDT